MRRRVAHVLQWGMAAVAAAMIATSSGSGALAGVAQAHQVAAVSSVSSVPDHPVLLGPEELPGFDGWDVGTLPAWFSPPAAPALPKSSIPPPTPPIVAALGASGIPQIALRAYVNAARSIAVSSPSCHLDWSVLAAIGRVESNHGRFGGAQLRADGSTTEPIRGIALDGGPGVARILDTDGGGFDGDVTFDRAVGPMQFLPSTWHFVAADGNGDGEMDPNNIFDATLGAARYLCAGGADLSDRAALTGAILRYNHSSDYAALVLALAAAYHSGQSTLPPVEQVRPAPPVTTPALPPVNVGTPPGLSDPGSGDGTVVPDPSPTPTPPVTPPPSTPPPSCPPTTDPADGSTTDPGTDPATDPATDSSTSTSTDTSTPPPSCPPTTEPPTDPTDTPTDPTDTPTDPTETPTDTPTDPTDTPTDPGTDPSASTDPTVDPTTTGTTTPTDGTSTSPSVSSGSSTTATPTATATAI